MRKEYDFSKGKRGAVLEVAPGKTRITIRVDDNVLEWFRKQAHKAGGGNYQSMINEALREHVENEVEPLEETFRRVLREELPKKRVAATVRGKKVEKSRTKGKKKSRSRKTSRA